MSSFRLEDLLVNRPVVDTGKTNLLLIDNAVMDSQVFGESANNSTFPIIYSTTSAKSDLLTVLRMNFTTINRIAVCFTFMSNSEMFLDYQPFFNDNGNESSESPYSANIAFLISVIKEFKVTNIDFLACDTLNYPNWINYYNILSKETNVVVGASNNRTGNITYGGDWIMENTCQDIEFIYFTTNIGHYKYLLDLTSSTILITDATGYIWGCGSNSSGQLGIGNTTSQASLTLMTNTTGKTPMAVACGQNYTIVLMTDFSIWGCGLNGSGQLGTGNTTPQTSLTLMTNTTGKTPLAVSCSSSHTIVLMTDFSIWGCGLNGSGQLGTSDMAPRFLLAQMSSIPSGKTPMAVACGASYTIVLMTDFSIWGCGINNQGQLGIGNTTVQRSLTLMSSMPAGKTPLTVDCGQNYTIVLMTDFSIWGCGYNLYGQLGTGNITQQTSLTLMTNTTGKSPLAVACGSNHTIVLMNDGSVYGCGYNFYGQLGTGNTTQQTSLTLMTNTTGKKPLAVACGASHTIVLMTDFSIWVCGFNFSGQLGIGNTISQNLLIQITYSDPLSGTTVSNFCRLSNSRPNLATMLGTYSLAEVRPAGYTKSEFTFAGYTVSQLKAASFTAFQLKIAGFSATELTAALFTAAELKAALFTASQLKIAGYTITDLLGVGFTLADLASAGYTKAQFTAANPLYTASYLKAAPASFTATQLKTAGFLAAELKTVGFLAAELKAALFTAFELKVVLFTASELKAGLFTAAELKTAGFQAAELKTAGFTAAELKPAGFTVSELKTAGFTLSDFRFTLLRIWYRDTYGDGWDGGGSISFNESSTNLNLITLTGPPTGSTDSNKWFYTDIPFKNNIVYNVTKINGNSPSEMLFAITNTTISAYLTTTTPITTLTSSTVLAETSNINTFSLQSSAYYYSALELKTAGFTAAEFKTDGVFTLAELKAALFTASQLKIAGYTINGLLGVGFTLADLASAGYTNVDFTAANSLYTASFLKASPQSYTASQLKAALFTATELKAALFTATELKAALFTATELKAALFTALELKAAGYTFEELRDAMYSLSELSIYFPSISNVSISSHNYKKIYINGADFKNNDIVIFNGSLVPLPSSYSVFFTNSTLLEVTMDSPYEIESVTVTDIYGNSNNTFIVTPDLISNICFIAGTPITTDQGNIPIEKIETSIHTIRNKKIVAITKTVTQDKYLVCFEKDSLGKNIPSQKTIISKNHKLFYNGKMRMAKEFLKDFSSVVKVKYTGSALYNVLLEEHDKMMVNYLICETLDPENGVAKVYMALQKLDTAEEKQSLIRKINAHVIKNDVFNNNNNSNKKAIK